MPTITLLKNHSATVGAKSTPTRCVPQLWIANSTTRIAQVMPMTALLVSPALTCRPDTADSTAHAQRKTARLKSVRFAAAARRGLDCENLLAQPAAT